MEGNDWVLCKGPSQTMWKMENGGCVQGPVAEECLEIADLLAAVSKPVSLCMQPPRHQPTSPAAQSRKQAGLFIANSHWPPRPNTSVPLLSISGAPWMFSYAAYAQTSYSKVSNILWYAVCKSFMSVCLFVCLSFSHSHAFMCVINATVCE